MANATIGRSPPPSLRNGNPFRVLLLITRIDAAAMGVSTPSTLGYIPTDTPTVLGLYWATVGNDGSKKPRTARLCGVF